MSRYLLVDADGETIVATLTMTEADARLNVGAGQSLVEIVVDSGPVIDNAVVKYAEDGIVHIADDTPVAALAGLEMAVLV